MPSCKKCGTSLLGIVPSEEIKKCTCLIDTDMTDLNEKKWHDEILDEFRKSDLYKKSKGVNLFALFYEWLHTNYFPPEKKI